MEHLSIDAEAVIRVHSPAQHHPGHRRGSLAMIIIVQELSLTARTTPWYVSRMRAAVVCSLLGLLVSVLSSLGCNATDTPTDVPRSDRSAVGPPATSVWCVLPDLDVDLVTGAVFHSRSGAVHVFAVLKHSHEDNSADEQSDIFHGVIDRTGGRVRLWRPFDQAKIAGRFRTTEINDGRILVTYARNLSAAHAFFASQSGSWQPTVVDYGDLDGRVRDFVMSCDEAGFLWRAFIDPESPALNQVVLSRFQVTSSTELISRHRLKCRSGSPSICDLRIADSGHARLAVRLGQLGEPVDLLNCDILDGKWSNCGRIDSEYSVSTLLRTTDVRNGRESLCPPRNSRDVWPCISTTKSVTRCLWVSSDTDAEVDFLVFKSFDHVSRKWQDARVLDFKPALGIRSICQATDSDGDTWISWARSDDLVRWNIQLVRISGSTGNLMTDVVLNQAPFAWPGESGFGREIGIGVDVVSTSWIQFMDHGSLWTAVIPRHP